MTTLIAKHLTRVPECGTDRARRRRRGYMLLETVVAAGMLVVGLAVIGSQFHDSQMAIRKMERRVRAFTLAEQQLAFLDLGLIELESIDSTGAEGAPGDPDPASGVSES